MSCSIEEPSNNNTATTTTTINLLADSNISNQIQKNGMGDGGQQQQQQKQKAQQSSQIILPNVLNDSIISSGVGSNSNTTYTTLSNAMPTKTSSSVTNSHEQQTNFFNSSSPILFPLHSPPLPSQQYSPFIDTNNQLSTGQNTTSVNLFSPLESSSDSFFTFQLTSNYQTTTISSNNQQQEHQQQHQQQLKQQNQLQQQMTQPQTGQQQTLFVMHNTSPNGLVNGQIDFDGHVSYTAQTNPITSQWLLDNFEPAEGCSLLRKLLYNYYLLHCSEKHIGPVNQASFGKLIRNVFLGLRTRRLGTRGNSKYHYNGIRVKVNSPLNQIPLSLSPTRSPNKQRPVSNKANGLIQIQNHHHQQNPHYMQNIHYHSDQTQHNNYHVQHQQHYQFIPAANLQCPTLDEKIRPMNIPELGKISEENLQLPLNCTLEDVKKFEELYKQQCTTIFEMFLALKMNSIKSIWMNFWRSKADIGDISDEQHESGPSISFYEEQLSSEKFFSLCEVPQVYEFIKHCDFQFYQFCIEFLIPDVFGFLPQQELNPIRKFAKSLECWLTKALQNVPEKLKISKLCIIKAFSMVLRRNTALNHLITTVHILFSNEQLVNMSHDLNKVDFNYIKEKLRWTCNWEFDETFLNRFEDDFKKSLLYTDPPSMKRWLLWIDEFVTSYMEKYENTEIYVKMAKNLILTWSYICDSAVRDLTLRTALTFGGFCQIRLLNVEYITYLIERKIAQHFNKPPLEIMCQENLFNTF